MVLVAYQYIYFGHKHPIDPYSSAPPYGALKLSACQYWVHVLRGETTFFKGWFLHAPKHQPIYLQLVLP